MERGPYCKKGDREDPGNYNNTQKATIVSQPSATHPQLWAELHIHVHVSIQECTLSHIFTSTSTCTYINTHITRSNRYTVQLSSGKKNGGMLFADDFVGVSDSKESLQKLIDVVHGYCNKWRLKANSVYMHIR